MYKVVVVNSEAYDILYVHYEVLTFWQFVFFLNLQMILLAIYLVSPVDLIPEGGFYALTFIWLNFSCCAVLVSSTLLIHHPGFVCSCSNVWFAWLCG